MPLHRRIASGVALLLLYSIVVFLLPRPVSVKPEGWRLLGIFVATIGGLILRPIPGGALVLAAITLAAIFGGLSASQALGGFGDPVVWLVMAAFFISDALITTGLARRIAVLFVRAVGGSSLGVCYALSLTDMLLAPVIPSNGARSGGVVLPVARSVAELYGSCPGPTAARLVSDDRRLSEHLRHSGHVHDRPSQQSIGGEDRHRNTALSSDAGELVRRLLGARAVFAAGGACGGLSAQPAANPPHAGS